MEAPRTIRPGDGPYPEALARVADRPSELRLVGSLGEPRARVAIVGARPTDEYGADLVETTLEVQIRNATPATLTVRRDAFRLLGSEGTALKPQTWRAADPLTIDGGATGTFELRFMTRGGLECAGEMALDVDAGLALPDGPVKIGSVKFVPSRG